MTGRIAIVAFGHGQVTTSIGNSCGARFVWTQKEGNGWPELAFSERDYGVSAGID